MNTLYTLNKADINHCSVQNCLAMVDKNDTLVLIEDGVYLLENIQKLQAQCKVIALKTDSENRGIDTSENTCLIADKEFVDLCCQHDRVVNWF